MSARDNGGPAFPFTRERGDYDVAYAGMTLRDYFAAAALTGMLARGHEAGQANWAGCAYELADDMLHERDK